MREAVVGAQRLVVICQEQLDASLVDLEALRREAGALPEELGDTSELADLRRQVQQLRKERDSWLSNRGGSHQTDGVGGIPADPSSLMLGLIKAEAMPSADAWGTWVRRCHPLWRSPCGDDLFPRCKVWIEGRIGEAFSPWGPTMDSRCVCADQNRFNELSDGVQPTVLDEPEGIGHGGRHWCFGVRFVSGP